MSQPAIYNRQYNFAEYQALNPSTPLPGNQVDLELNSVKITLDQTLANIKLLQRDDGKLANGSVSYDQLSSDLAVGLPPAAAWQTAAAYIPVNSVFFGVKLYRCLVAHTSGTFATDLAAGDWVLVADFSTLISSTGVSSLGNQQGAITINGGNLSGNVLTVPRYDAAQSLSGAQTLQARQNIAAAPITPDYVVGVANSELSAERVLTNTASVLWDISTAGQAKANIALQGDYLCGTTNAEDATARAVTDTATITWDKSIAGQAKANVVTAGFVTSIASLGGAFTLGIGLTNSGNVLALDPVYMRAYLAGFVLSTAGGSTTFGIAAGEAMGEAANAGLMRISNAITKTTSAWAVGTGNGSLDTGAIAANTWYHVYVIMRRDTGVVDVLTSLSTVVGITLPANYDVVRRIGSMKTDASSHWILFTQTGDTFIWSVPIQDGNTIGANSNSARTLLALTVAPGHVVEALFRAEMTGVSSSSTVLFSSPQEADNSNVANNADLGAANGGFSNGAFARLTNTSAQIGWRTSSSGATFNVYTYGWRDLRGK